MNDVGLFVGGSASAMVSRGRYAAAERRRRLCCLQSCGSQPRCARRQVWAQNQSKRSLCGQIANAGLVDAYTAVAISSVLQVATIEDYMGDVRYSFGLALFAT